MANKINYLNTDDFEYGSWEYSLSEYEVPKEAFEQLLDNMYGVDIEGDKKPYLEVIAKVISFFHSNYEDVTVVVTLMSIQIMFREYRKSWIPFCSEWVTTKHLDLQYEMPGWLLYLSRYFAEMDVTLSPADGHVLTVGGYSDTYRTCIVPRQSKEDQVIINKLQYILEYSLRPNSVDFIAGNHCEANV